MVFEKDAEEALRILENQVLKDPAEPAGREEGEECEEDDDGEDDQITSEESVTLGGVFVVFLLILGFLFIGLIVLASVSGP
jgi:hypothetical protein